MIVIENTLAWTKTARRIAGKVVAKNDGDEAAVLAVDLPLPKFACQSIVGMVSTSGNAPAGVPWSIEPAGVTDSEALGVPVAWCICIAVPDSQDLNGDGVVDGGDVGKVLAEWSAMEEPSAILGQVLAAQGDGDELVAAVAYTVESGGGPMKVKSSAPAVIPQCELVEPVDAVLRVRLGVSAGATVELVLDSTIVV